MQPACLHHLRHQWYTLLMGTSHKWGVLYLQQPATHAGGKQVRRHNALPCKMPWNEGHVEPQPACTTFEHQTLNPYCVQDEIQAQLKDADPNHEAHLLESWKAYKKGFQEGIAVFNKKPKKGVAFLQVNALSNTSLPNIVTRQS